VVPPAFTLNEKGPSFRYNGQPRPSYGISASAKATRPKKDDRGWKVSCSLPVRICHRLSAKRSRGLIRGLVIISFIIPNRRDRINEKEVEISQLPFEYLL
jgi:hypothetical protein